MSAIRALYQKIQRVIEKNKIAISAPFPTIGVAFLGEFSSGKTALLNALIGDSKELFAENIARETAIATKVEYTTKNENFYEINLGNRISKGDFIPPFSTKNFEDNVKLINVYLNTKSLHQYDEKDIYYIDLPGTNSGFGAHDVAINDSIMQNQYDTVIDSSIPDASIILICVPADTGNISDSLIRKVRAIHIANPKTMFVGVVTKSGLAKEGGGRVRDLLENTLKDILKTNLLGCVKTEAIEPLNIDELKSVLLNRNDKYFILNKQDFYKNYVEIVEIRLKEQESIFQKDIGEAELFIENSLGEIEKLEKNYKADMEKLKRELDAAVHLIVRDIINALIEKARTIKTESDANRIANEAGEQAINTHLIPLIKSFDDKYQAVSPLHSISVDTSDMAKTASALTSTISGALAAIAALIGSTMAIPIVGVIISAIGAIFSIFADSVEAKVSKELTSEKTRNAVKRAVQTAINENFNLIDQQISIDIKNKIKNIEEDKVLNENFKTRDERNKKIGEIKEDLAVVKEAFEDFIAYAKSNS